MRTLLPLLLLAACEPEPQDPGESVAEELAAGTISFETTLGTFVMEVDAEAAPLTVANVHAYVDAGFYDGRDGLGATIMHRVVSGFVVQGGGIIEQGFAPKRTEDAIDYEGSNGLDNVRGSVAMARTSDPNSATSQFYVNLSDNDALNHVDGQPGYTVFATIIEGMDVIDLIAGVATGERRGFSDVPVDDVVITNVMRGPDE